MHELAHVWQYRTKRLSALSYLLDPENWVYRYTVREGVRLDDYPVEAQADMVEDWFRMRIGLAPARYCGTAPTLDWLEAVVTFGPRLS